MSELKVSKSKSVDVEPNSELVKRTPIKNSPFEVITTEEGSFGSMGKWRITEVRETEKEVVKELEVVTWDRVIQIVMLINETINKK